MAGLFRHLDLKSIHPDKGAGNKVELGLSSEVSVAPRATGWRNSRTLVGGNATQLVARLFRHLDLKSIHPYKFVTILLPAPLKTDNGAGNKAELDFARHYLP